LDDDEFDDDGELIKNLEVFSVTSVKCFAHTLQLGVFFSQLGIYKINIKSTCRSQNVKDSVF